MVFRACLALRWRLLGSTLEIEKTLICEVGAQILRRTIGRTEICSLCRDILTSLRTLQCGYCAIGDLAGRRAGDVVIVHIGDGESRRELLAPGHQCLSLFDRWRTYVSAV